MNPHIPTPQTTQPKGVDVNAGLESGEERRPDPSISLAPQPGSPFYTPPYDEMADPDRPAHPRTGFFHPEAPEEFRADTWRQSGMTLREWYAGQVVSALLKHGLGSGTFEFAVDFAVSESFKIAEKMLQNNRKMNTPTQVAAAKPPIDAEA